MKLAQLTVEGILGAPDGTFSFTDDAGQPLDVVVLSGDEGSGTTSLLEAIGILKEHVGGYGAAPAPSTVLRGGAARGRVATSWALFDDERRRVGAPSALCSVELLIDKASARVANASADLGPLFERFSRDPGEGKFEYFPANRELEAVGGLPIEPVLPAALQAASRLGKARDKYAFVHGVLAEAALGAGDDVLRALRRDGVVLGGPSSDQLEPYRKAFARLTDRVRLDGMTMQARRPGLRFVRRDGAALGFDDLSASDRQALLFATTFVHLGLEHSIVLIDEPELHIHPARQADFLRCLSLLGADNQLIVASSSAGILRAARPHQVVRIAEPR
ncbi:MAG: AAA family ATPase [Polyangiaceae bacterium]